MTRRDDLVRLRDRVAEASGNMLDTMCLPEGADLEIAKLWAKKAREELHRAFSEIDALIAQEDAAPMTPVIQRGIHD